MISSIPFTWQLFQVEIRFGSKCSTILISHISHYSGNEDIVKLLNKYDVTVNVRNRLYWTPLFYSVLSGNPKVVKTLINHEDEDFNPNDIDAQGKTVFHHCAKQGNFVRREVDGDSCVLFLFLYRFCDHWKDFVLSRRECYSSG